MEEEKSEKSLKHKGLLVLIKYIYHILGLFYALYDLLGIFEIDAIILGYISHVSIIVWFILYFVSIVFRYCHIHRLPLYYILASEMLTVGNYLFDYSINQSFIMCLHLVFIMLLIFGYTHFYLKINDNFNKEYIKAIIK